MDFQYSPEQEAFRSQLRGWLDTHLPPELCVEDAMDERVAPDAELPVVEDVAGEQRDERLIDRYHGGAAIALGELVVALLEEGPAGAGHERLATAGARAAVAAHQVAVEVEELHLDAGVAASNVLDAQPGVLLAEVERVGLAARRIGEGREGERRCEQREQDERPHARRRGKPEAHGRAFRSPPPEMIRESAPISVEPRDPACPEAVETEPFRRRLSTRSVVH